MALTWEELRWTLQELAFGQAEYAGVPVPVHDARVAMAESHPRFRDFDGATLGPSPDAPSWSRTCEVSDGGELIRNSWWSKRLQSPVWIFEDPPGTIQYAVEPYAMNLEPLTRFTRIMETMAIGQQAWSASAELAAHAKLREHLSDPQWETYVLVGAFLESSKRSQAIYVFRKGRPTIVLLPDHRNGETMYRPSVALCHHPLAYYEGTFAGGMVPTDDVIAALLLMRSDEAGYWRRSNQHPIGRAEAGL